MGLPTTDEFLANLLRIWAECIHHRDQAQAADDKRLAASFQSLASECERMILEKGGLLPAGRRELSHSSKHVSDLDLAHSVKDRSAVNVRNETREPSAQNGWKVAVTDHSR